MKIQPISSWQDGKELQGTNFYLNTVDDNMSTSATFVYSIFTDEISHIETIIVTPEIPAWDETLEDGTIIHHDAVPEVTEDVKIIDEPSIQLVNGKLVIDGVDYQQWDADPSANAWAYNWSANKLNLILIPDQVFA